MKARLHLFLSIILIFALVFPASALPGKEPCSSGLPHPPAANVDVRRNLTGQGAISKTTPNVHLYLYTGEQFDPDLGFYYLRARYSNPDSGRFWTMDSYLGRGGEPLTLHKYLYCHANPGNGTDPSGHTFLADLMAGISQATAIAGNVAIRFIPLGNSISVILVESAAGTSVVLGGAGVVVAGGVIKSGLIPKVAGGWPSFIEAAKTFSKKIFVGHHGGLTKALKDTGRQSNHLNQFKAFEGTIPEADGVAVEVVGDILDAGSQHNLFHRSLEGFWNTFRGSGRRPSCGQYGEAVEKALVDSGFAVQEAKALSDLARKNREFFGLLDDDLIPNIPGAIPNLP